MTYRNHHKPAIQVHSFPVQFNLIQQRTDVILVAEEPGTPNTPGVTERWFHQSQSNRPFLDHQFLHCRGCRVLAPE